jgi:hypothetical protein
MGAHSSDIPEYLKSYPGFNPEVKPDITRMIQVWAPATESTESVKISVVKPPHTKIPDLKSNLGL